MKYREPEAGFERVERLETLAAPGGGEAKRQSAMSMGRKKEGQEEKRGIPDAR